jgi:hypothetical protein
MLIPQGSPFGSTIAQGYLTGYGTPPPPSDRAFLQSDPIYEKCCDLPTCPANRNAAGSAELPGQARQTFEDLLTIRIS